MFSFKYRQNATKKLEYCHVAFLQSCLPTVSIVQINSFKKEKKVNSWMQKDEIAHHNQQGKE